MSDLISDPKLSYFAQIVPDDPDKRKKYDLRYISTWNIVATAAVIPALYYLYAKFAGQTCALTADICHQNTPNGADACVKDAIAFANTTNPYVAPSPCYTINSLDENAILATICFSTFLFLAGVAQVFFLTFGYDGRFRHYWAWPTGILYFASVCAFFACGIILLTMADNNEPDSPNMKRVKYVAGVVLTIGATLIGGIWVCYQSIESASAEYGYQPVTAKIKKFATGRT